MMIFLSKKVGRNYKRLARNLEISDSCIDDIEHDKLPYHGEKCLRVFRHLKRKYGIVKWNQIKKALQAFHQTQIISDFISEYPNFP